MRKHLRWIYWALGLIQITTFGPGPVLAQVGRTDQKAPIPNAAPVKPAEALRLPLAQIISTPIINTDLSVPEIRLGKEKFFQGEQVEAGAVIRNQGTKDLAGVKVRFSLDGRPWGPDQVIRLLRANSQETVTMALKAETPGRHELAVMVDPFNEIPETNKDNNAGRKNLEVLLPTAVSLKTATTPGAAAVGPIAGLRQPVAHSGPGNLELRKNQPPLGTLLSAPLPNLVLSDVTVTPTVFNQGDKITIKYRIINKGTGKAEPRPGLSVNVNDYFTHVTAPAASGPFLGPGESSPFYTFIREADCKNKIRIEVQPLPAETDKADNVWEKQLDAQKCYADPAVTDFTYNLIQVKSNAAADIKLTGTVRNLKSGDFNSSGTIFLRQGSKVLDSKPLTQLAAAGPPIQIVYSAIFSCLYGPNQSSGYSLSIEYAPGLNLPQIDTDLTNNKKEITALELCGKIQGQNQGGSVTGLLKLINQYRQKNGKGLLSIDGCLSAAAQKHSQWMNTTGNYLHQGENGSEAGDRCAQAGCSCSTENIDKNGWDLTGQKTFDSWLNSADHNANMLGPYGKIGIGVAGTYVTAVFQ